MSAGDNSKKPLKFVEIPINNFKENAIPHHLQLVSKHKEIVQKGHEDKTKMQNETASIKRVIQQLKDLLYELDTLRTQVIDSDLDKFDMKTVSLRKNILQIINEYTDLLKITTAVFTPSATQIEDSKEDLSSEPRQLQISANLEELKIEDKAATLNRVESLQTDIQDLHSAYGTLHQMVVEQKEDVNVIEENVETAHHNVKAAAQHLESASRFKASVYPVTGAIVGTCVGGPLGLIAGLKIGGIAAVTCGLLGYVGGKVVKKHKINITPEKIEGNAENSQENIENPRIKKDE